MRRSYSSVRKVPKTGMYRVQKGMEVIPVNRVKKLKTSGRVKKMKPIKRVGGRR